jgi:hypothetical protein
VGVVGRPIIVVPAPIIAIFTVVRHNSNTKVTVNHGYTIEIPLGIHIPKGTSWSDNSSYLYQ